MPSPPSGHRRCRGRGLLFLAMVASLFTVVLSTNSQWTLFDCQQSTAASSSTNSVFWSNVVALMDALPSAAAPTGFASLSRGNGTDRAFVRGICRGDSTAAQCATYIQNAALSIRSRCNTTRRAAIWYDDGSTVAYPAPMFCFVSYADTNTSTAYEDAYRQEFQNSVVVTNTVGFETAYSTLMSSISGRVVNGSGMSSPAVAPMFATGAAVYDATAPNGTMYGLLQCMRDRTAAECAKCLNDSVQQLPSCCRGQRGGVVLGYNCYLRMEVYPYYDLALDGPSIFVGESRPGKKTHGAILPVALALAVGTVLAAVTIVGVFLYRRKANQKQNPQASNVIEHLNVFQGHISQLTAMKINLDDKVQELLLLNPLSDSWNTLVVSLSNSSPYRKLTPNMVKNNLLNEKTKRKEKKRAAISHLLLMHIYLKRRKLWLKPSEISARQKYSSTIIGKGTVCIETSIGNKLTLKNVRHVPAIRLNLVLMGKLDDIGLGSYFGEEKWELTNGSLILARGAKKACIYVTKTKLCKSDVNIAERDSSIELCHKRLGHMSEKGLHSLVHKNFLPEFKARRLPWPDCQTYTYMMQFGQQVGSRLPTVSIWDSDAGIIVVAVAWHDVSRLASHSDSTSVAKC
ncbi:unnamed protein product [Miscanthus lutarioriparius]|uniref:Gnk2-homologous domain-containing protein n=1 Tax=Miscanthus lutarioriparius TaxID=422564 RepID=A0A811PM76_9POAL|nr:unnamed protein product [Miscanthus lutarioriparius]